MAGWVDGASLAPQDGHPCAQVAPLVHDLMVNQLV